MHPLPRNFRLSDLLFRPLLGHAAGRPGARPASPRDPQPRLRAARGAGRRPRGRGSRLLIGLALLNLACAGARRSPTEITYADAPPAIRAAVDTLEKDRFATALQRALLAYDQSLQAIDREAWDRAYAELQRAHQEMQMAAPSEEEDPLLLTAAELLRQEVDLLLEETEVHTSVEPLSGELAVEGDSTGPGADSGRAMLIEHNAKVQHYVRLFTGSRRRSFEASLRRSGRYLPMIEEILAEEGVPAELAWLPVIESGMRATAVSRARAVGLWQFIRSTGRLYHLRIDEFVDQRRDPRAATRAAARHLRDLHDHFQDWPLALAAYNSGTRRVERAISKAGTRDYWQLKLPRETREYVPQFFAAVILATDPVAAGLTPGSDPPLRHEEVEVPELVALETIAECCGSSEKELRELNPHLWRTLTPPGESTVVRVPAGTSGRFADAFARLPRTALASTVSHRVRRGETLSGIASRYGSSVRLISAANHLRSSHRIRAGQKLLIPVRGTRVAKSNASSERSSRRASGESGYTVRHGDSLWSIARRYGVSVERLIRSNGLQRKSVLHPGQHLRIPGRSGASTYFVARGDNLSAIAKEAHVSVADLVRWNELNPKRPIHPGQRLRLAPPPGSGGARAAGERLKTHRVAPGESVYTIAKRYGVRTSDVLRWNQLDSSALIHPGDRLEIWSLQ
jgi:membrane-bound lytic murein transglycosylase D